jgi:hypothetical protein
MKHKSKRVLENISNLVKRYKFLNRHVYKGFKIQNLVE